MSKLTFPGPVPREGESIYGTGPNGITPRPDYIIDRETGCWEWQKFRLKGYGMATPHGRAHRVYYQLANGPIEKGEHVHHRCHNTGCVNPAHLEHVDKREHWEGHFLNGRGGITLEDVREIRRLGRLDGQSQTKVAEQFGINRWTVRMYWRGERWAKELGEDGPVRPPVRTCGLEGCNNPVIGRRDKRFCTGEHASHHWKRQQRLALTTASASERRREGE